MELPEWAQVVVVAAFGVFIAGIVVVLVAFRVLHRISCLTSQVGVLVSLVIVLGAEIYRLVCCFWGNAEEDSLVAFYGIPELLLSVLGVYVWLSHVERVFVGQGDENTNFMWTGAAAVYVCFAVLCLVIALNYDEQTVAACIKVFSATAMLVTAFGLAFTVTELQGFAMSYVPIHLDLIEQFIQRIHRFAMTLCSSLTVLAMFHFILVFQGSTCWISSPLWIIIPTLVAKVILYSTICAQYGQPPLNLVAPQPAASRQSALQQQLLP